MATSTSTRTGIALAAVTALVSGVAVYLNGMGVRSVGDATTYTMAKNLVAALVLLAVATGVAATRGTSGIGARGRARDGSVDPDAGSDAGSDRLEDAGPSTSRGRWLGPRLAVAVVGGSVPFVLFFEGLSRADSVDAAFIHKTLVVWVAILAVAFLREQTGARHLVAVALLLGGQVVLVGGLPALSWGGGEAMIAAATLLWAIEFVVAKRALADIPSHELAAWRMGGGSVLLVGWVLVSGRAGTLLAITPTGWAWVLGTGLLLSVYVGTWYAALARIPAVDVAAVLVAGAIVTAVLQAGFDGAPLAPNAVGLGLLGAGALVAARPWARMRGGAGAAAGAAAPPAT